MKVFKLTLIIFFLMTSQSSAATPSRTVLTYKVNGYSSYSISLNGYKIIEDNSDMSSVRILPPFLKKGENEITLKAQKATSPAEHTVFQVRINPFIEGMTSFIDDNPGSILKIDQEITGELKQNFTIIEDVEEPFWDKTCIDQSAAMWKLVELNNAYVDKDFNKVKELSTIKLQHNLHKTAKSAEEQFKNLEQSMQYMTGFKKLTADNYKDHVKFEVIKENEIYKIKTYFADPDGSSTELEGFVGCLNAKVEILF